MACTLTGAVDIILGSKSVSPETDSAVAIVGMDAGGMYIARPRFLLGHRRKLLCKLIYRVLLQI